MIFLFLLLLPAFVAMEVREPPPLPARVRVVRRGVSEQTDGGTLPSTRTIRVPRDGAGVSPALVDARGLAVRRLSQCTAPADAANSYTAGYTTFGGSLNSVGSEWTLAPRNYGGSYLLYSVNVGGLSPFPSILVRLRDVPGTGCAAGQNAYTVDVSGKSDDLNTAGNGADRIPASGNYLASPINGWTIAPGGGNSPPRTAKRSPSPCAPTTTSA